MTATAAMAITAISLTWLLGGAAVVEEEILSGSDSNF
jgi:hypothetical protein